MTKREIRILAKEITKNVHDVVMNNTISGPRPWVPGKPRNLFGLDDQAPIVEAIIDLVCKVVDSGGVQLHSSKPKAKKKSPLSSLHSRVSNGPNLFDDDDDLDIDDDF